jgi:hypothetical protein
VLKKRSSIRIASAALVVAVAAGAGLLVGGTANASPPHGSLGSLTLDHSTGTDITALQTETSAGCSTGGDSFTQYITGPVGIAGQQTFPAAKPYPLTVNTTAGWSASNPFAAAFSSTLKDAAQKASDPQLYGGTGTLQSGEYDITVHCIDGFTLQDFGTFTGALYFSDSAHFTTTDPNGGGGPTTTTTTLAVTPASPAAAGAMETLKATFSPAAAGSVQFMDGTTKIGGTVTVSGGTASMTTTLPSGTRSLTAVFTSTDQGFSGSTSAAVSYVVNAGQGTGTPTTTALVVTPASPAAAGAMETLKATISPAAPGKVQFKDGNTTNIGEPVTVSGGTASTTTTLASGDHSLTAEFTPTDNTAFNGSTSAAVPLTVTGAAGGGDQSLSAIIAKVVDQLQRAVQVLPILRLFLQPLIHFLQFLSQFTQTGLQFHPGRR